MTVTQQKRLEDDWHRLAQLPLTFLQEGIFFYAFGDELAISRLFIAYNRETRNHKTRMSKCPDGSGFYFSLQMY